MPKRILLALIVAIAAAGGYFLYHHLHEGASQRTMRVLAYLRDPESHADWEIRAKTRCGNAPFLMPTSGFIGYLWDDSFKVGHRHQGIDIFAGTPAGVTPVYAAYDAYLTRLSNWKSAVILRVPSDPLHPSRQIWLYYAHMASPTGDSYIQPEFPPGSKEIFVPAGTLLGYQGNYSGDPLRPVGVHLHFSIVRDKNGTFLNELDIHNTLDPSPYFGIELNAHHNHGEIPTCKETETTP
jgi:murein DD-endopeptidase MepM/ murein hydrolase activator NlpD